MNFVFRPVTLGYSPPDSTLNKFIRREMTYPTLLRWREFNRDNIELWSENGQNLPVNLNWVWKERESDHKADMLETAISKWPLKMNKIPKNPETHWLSLENVLQSFSSSSLCLLMMFTKDKKIWCQNTIDPGHRKRWKWCWVM